MGDGVWEDPAWIDLRGRMLVVRNQPEVIAQVRRQVDAIRAQAIWKLATTAEIVKVPEALASRLGMAGVISPEGSRLLREGREKGHVETVDAVRLTNIRGVRNFVREGQAIPYLQDFEVEIAQAANIGNPVMQHAFSGTQLDIEAARSVDGGDGEAMQQNNVEFSRTDVPMPIRTLDTRHGPIEFREMELFRVRTGVQIPLGETAIVASWVPARRAGRVDPMETLRIE